VGPRRNGSLPRGVAAGARLNFSVNMPPSRGVLFVCGGAPNRFGQSILAAQCGRGSRGNVPISSAPSSRPWAGSRTIFSARVDWVARITASTPARRRRERSIYHTDARGPVERTHGAGASRIAGLPRGSGSGRRAAANGVAIDEQVGGGGNTTVDEITARARLKSVASRGGILHPAPHQLCLAAKWMNKLTDILATATYSTPHAG